MAENIINVSTRKDLLDIINGNDDDTVITIEIKEGDD